MEIFKTFKDRCLSCDDAKVDRGEDWLSYFGA